MSSIIKKLTILTLIASISVPLVSSADGYSSSRSSKTKYYPPTQQYEPLRPYRPDLKLSKQEAKEAYRAEKIYPPTTSRSTSQSYNYNSYYDNDYYNYDNNYSYNTYNKKNYYNYQDYTKGYIEYKFFEEGNYHYDPLTYDIYKYSNIW